MKNHPLGKSVSNGGNGTHDMTKPKQLHKNGSQLRELGKLSTEGLKQVPGEGVKADKM